MPLRRVPALWNALSESGRLRVEMVPGMLASHQGELDRVANAPLLVNPDDVSAAILLPRQHTLVRFNPENDLDRMSLLESDITEAYGSPAWHPCSPPLLAIALRSLQTGSLQTRTASAQLWTLAKLHSSGTV